MSANAVAKALIEMHEHDDLRREVAEGRFGRFEALELTDEERELLRGATEELPPGHESKVLVAFEPEAEVVGHSMVPAQAGYWPPGTAGAIEYARDGLTDTNTQAQFVSFQRAYLDNFP